jgi:hypothetical protein
VDESDDADYVRENILSKYYEQEFAPRLDAYIESLLADEKYYSDIISRYDEYVSYAERFMGKDGNLGYNRGLHIAERLIEVFDKLRAIEESKPREDRVIFDRKIGEITFRLNDIRLRGLNHKGVVRGLLPVIDKCNENKLYISPMDYIHFKTRAAQLYFNSFEYVKVKDLFIDDVWPRIFAENAKKNIDIGSSETLIEQLERVMAGLTGIENTTQVVSGKIFSTLGQAYAFMGDESISESWFESALEKWSGDVANQNITLSYLMNLYVDTANMGGYEKYAPQYFGFFDTKGLGCDSVAGQLKVLKEAYLNRQFIRYALSVFVKAFYKFYNDSNYNHWNSKYYQSNRSNYKVKYSFPNQRPSIKL